MAEVDSGGHFDHHDGQVAQRLGRREHVLLRIDLAAAVGAAGVLPQGIAVAAVSSIDAGAVQSSPAV